MHLEYRLVNLPKSRPRSIILKPGGIASQCRTNQALLVGRKEFGMGGRFRNNEEEENAESDGSASFLLLFQPAVQLKHLKRTMMNIHAHAGTPSVPFMWR
jgi:hypothetical protein